MGSAVQCVPHRDLLQAALLSTIAWVRTEEGRLACARRLKGRLTHYNSKHEYCVGNTIKATKEGKRAVSEALAFLADSRKESAESSDFSCRACVPLSLAGQDHACDLDASGRVSHEGSDGSRPADRMSRYCVWRDACGEVIWYGQLPTYECEEIEEKEETYYLAKLKQRLRDCAAQIIDDFIIDDGVPDRGHRSAVFDTRFNLGGVGISTHPIFGHVVVIDFATAILLEENLIDSNLPEEGIKCRQAADMRETIKEKVEQMRQRELNGPLRLQVVPPTSSSATQPLTQWTELGMCVHCAQSIRGGKVVEVKSRKYHAACFVCFTCAGTLAGSPFLEVPSTAQTAEAMPAIVCQACYITHFAPVCGHCKERIAEKRSVKYQEVAYHVHCFEVVKQASSKVVMFETPLGSTQEYEPQRHLQKGGAKSKSKKSGEHQRSIPKAKGAIASIIDEYASLV